MDHWGKTTLMDHRSPGEDRINGSPGEDRLDGLGGRRLSQEREVRIRFPLSPVESY